jgi:hypothetical protein
MTTQSELNRIDDSSVGRVKRLVKIIYVVGKENVPNHLAEKHSHNTYFGIPNEDEPYYYHIKNSFQNVDRFLISHGKSLLPREGFEYSPQVFNFLPYIDKGVITSFNAGSIYDYNNCSVANLFLSGNGSNFGQGDYRSRHVIISAGVSEEDIQKTFVNSKDACRFFIPERYWQEGSPFREDVNEDQSRERGIELLLKLNPTLISH